MRRFKAILYRFFFGDANIHFGKFLQHIFKEQLNSLTIRIDSLSIFFFLGRWLPFSVAIGITTGVIASLMDLLVVQINGILSRNIVYLFVYPLMVAFITGQVLKKDKEIGGPGIGFSILHLKTKRYLKIRSILYKLFVSVLTLSGGFIAGREGPSFYLGVGIGEWVGKAYGFGKRFKDMLGLIGAGAFTGALLKAPLGSSIFAMELENMYDFNYRPFIPMIVASIVSYLTFSFFRGNHAFILLQSKPVWDLTSIPYIIAMGLVISLIIYIYTFVFHFLRKAAYIFPVQKRVIVGTLISIPFLVLLYLVTRNSDILSAPANMNILSNLAQMQFSVSADIAIIIFTILITSFTLGFGVVGGLILPVLMIGAALGNIFGHIFPDQLIMFTLAGMGASLAAAAKTPLAAIVMITEMSHDDVVIPMTAAVITSYLASFGYSLYLGQENIFRGSLKDFRSYRLQPDEKHDEA